MDELKAGTVGEARTLYALELTLWASNESERVESWCRDITQASLHQYVERVCAALYHQAKADAEALVEQYKSRPLAQSVEAEDAAAGQVHEQIGEAIIAHMEALTDVSNRLEWHPTVAHLQRLLDLSPPPRDDLEPSPPEPGDTTRRANERILWEHKRELFMALLYYTREDARDTFAGFRDRLMARVLTEFDHGSGVTLRQYHELPSTTDEAEQHEAAYAKAAVDRLWSACRARLSFTLDELAAWEEEVGLYNLACIASAVRRYWNAEDSEEDKIAVVQELLGQLQAG